MKTRGLQEVYLAVSQAGRPGWFTNGIMAWPLTHNEYDQLTEYPERQRAAAEKLGFVLRAANP